MQYGNNKLLIYHFEWNLCKLLNSNNTYFILINYILGSTQIHLVRNTTYVKQIVFGQKDTDKIILTTNDQYYKTVKYSDFSNLRTL
jgi:hypothetical protein